MRFAAPATFYGVCQHEQTTDLGRIKTIVVKKKKNVNILYVGTRTVAFKRLDRNKPDYERGETPRAEELLFSLFNRKFSFVRFLRSNFITFTRRIKSCVNLINENDFDRAARIRIIIANIFE